MPRLVPVLALVLCAPIAHAASGGASVVVSHAGFLVDSADAPLEATALALTFTVHGAATGGSAEWTATCPVDVRQGYYAVDLGGSACPGDGLETSDLLAGTGAWLQVHVGSADLLPRQRLQLAPLAELARDAQSLGGTPSTGWLKKSETTLPLQPTGTASASTFLRGDGTWAAPGPTGATNVGSGGAGIFDAIAGGQLQFRKLNAGSARVSVVVDGATNEVRVDVVESALDLANAGGTLPAAKGGTGLTSPGASGNVLKSNGSAWQSAPASGLFTDLAPTGSFKLPEGLIGDLPPAAGHEGELRYVTVLKRVVFSDGASWITMAQGGAIGSQTNPALDCTAVYASGQTTSGPFWITGVANGTAYRTDCRHDLLSGGWTLLVRGNTNDVTNPLGWYDHAWWSSFGALGNYGDGNFAPGYSGVFPWTQLLVVLNGTSSYLVLSSGTTSSLASGLHGNLTVSNANGAAALANGAVLSRNLTRSSGNGLVMRKGRWLVGSCDGTECFNVHGFGVAGENHGGAFYAQASSMFQTYSYGAGTAESVSIYAK